MRRKTSKKRSMSLLLVLLMIISLFTGVSKKTVSASDDEEDDNWIINCTEKEAYEKGYDFYRAWYIVNKGHFKDIVLNYVPPQYSAVLKKRNDSSYQTRVFGYRALTLNWDELIPENHSNKEKAYVESLLFNLIYNEKTGSLYSTVSGEGADLLKEMSNNLKNTQYSVVKKLFDSVEGYSKAAAETSKEANPEFYQQVVETANSAHDFSSMLGEVDFLHDLFDYSETAAEYVNGLCKLNEVVGRSNAISNVFAGMSNLTDNNAYQSALNNFSDYLSESITQEQAIAIFTGSTAYKEGWDIAIDVVHSAVVKALKPYLGGVELGAAIGKFASNLLTGIDDEFNKFNELEVYYDVEQLLRAEVLEYFDYLNDDYDYGTEFLAAYAMLHNMYIEGLDCYKEYADIIYKSGVLNTVLPWINSGKYDEAINTCNELEAAIDKMFEDDFKKAGKAYKTACAKYDQKLDQPETSYTLPDNIDESVEYFEQHRECMGFQVKNNRILTGDMTIYGSVEICGGKLNLNGHSLIIYGNLYMEYGEIIDNGVLNVMGDIYQFGGSIDISGARILSVGGNYHQKDGEIEINGGKLEINGDWLINEDRECCDARLSAYDDSEIEVGGNVTGIIPYGYGNINMSSGAMSIGGNLEFYKDKDWNCWEFECSSDFSITMQGERSLVIQNVIGPNMCIENAAEREITFSGSVQLNNLTGGQMVINPDNLEFSATVPDNIKFLGDVAWDGKGTIKKNMVITGQLVLKYGNLVDDGTIEIDRDLLQTGGCLEIACDKTMYLTGNYHQKDGEIETNGGKLEINGDWLINEDRECCDARLSAYDDSEIEVGGNVTGIIPYGYGNINMSSGAMSIGGNLEFYKDKDWNCWEFECSSDFSITMQGERSLVIQNVIGPNMCIENAAEREMTFSGSVQLNNLTGGQMVINPDNLEFSATVPDNIKFLGDVAWDGKGTIKKSMVITGQLVLKYGNLVDDGMIGIDRDLLQTGGCLEIACDKTMYVTGNYHQKDGEIETNGGKLEINGDWLINEDRECCDARLSAYDDSEIEVGGNVTGIIPFGDGNINMSSGTMNIGGNLEFYKAKDWNCWDFECSSDFSITMQGERSLVIQNVIGPNMCIENASEREITFSDNVRLNKLIGESMTVDASNLKFGAELTDDLYVIGGFEIVSNITLGDNKLSVNGDVVHSYGCLDIGKGTFETIESNYYLTSKEYYDDGEDEVGYGNIQMTEDEGKMNIGLDMVIYSYSQSDLEAGTLTVDRDFIQKAADRDNFTASGTHTTILPGNYLQRISFESYPDSHFNRLILKAEDYMYVFNPEECAEGAEQYCSHSSTIIENASKATCTEDGYTGDTVCAKCKLLLSKGSIIRAEGHKPVVDKGYAATCTKDGKKDGKHCEKCNKVLIEQAVIKAEGHKWNAGKATIIESGADAGKNATLYTCTVCGATKYENIAAKSIKNTTVTYQKTYTYTGSVKKPTVTVKDGTKQLVLNKDYKVSYSNNKNAGTGVITISGIGAYTGTVKKTFTISPRNVSSATVTGVVNRTYTGSKLTQTVSVTVGNSVLVEGTDYTVSYLNNLNVGSATVRISGKGNYTGTKDVTFKIIPKKTGIKTITAISKGFKVTWTAVKTPMSETRVSGYQIQYSTSSTFASDNVLKTVAGTNGYLKDNTSITGLKSGKTYYVRIRTVTRINNVNYASSWSATKTIKVK